MKGWKIVKNDSGSRPEGFRLERCRVYQEILPAGYFAFPRMKRHQRKFRYSFN